MKDEMLLLQEQNISDGELTIIQMRQRLRNKRKYLNIRSDTYQEDKQPEIY